MDNNLLLTKLAILPENLKLEVADFIDFLVEKTKKNEKAYPKQKPVFGNAKGMFIIHDDFDEPLEDFKTYMD
ncbi:DUF2281 domain-containing protein [Parasediminibacterium sp. JCM 36343]|uniref:type II toxin-antitoxin system VapB family antitoxin n=1 Tax=Parasediminibacterium sp. JCM 36343 TaxID=3374279 RepID=UPI00397BA98C